MNRVQQWIGKLLGIEQRPFNLSLEDPAVSLDDPATWDALRVGRPTVAGILVSHFTALTYPPVWQALSIISGDVASLPLHVYRRVEEDDVEIDYEHPADWLLSCEPNEEQDAYQFWRCLMVHALLWGNGYAWIDRGPGGKPKAIAPLLPDRTRPERLSRESVFAATGSNAQADKLAGTLVYVSEVGGKLKTYLPGDVLHIKGLSIDGFNGVDALAAARDAWSTGLAAMQFAAKFFKRGGRVGGILELPIAMSKKALDTAIEGFRKTYEGSDESTFLTVILRDNAKFHQAQVSPEQTQLVEAREFEARQVAARFNLPPHKLGIKDSVSYNSQEQAELAYLTGCLRHWLTGNRQEAQRKLLSYDDRKARKFFCDYNTTKLIETDEMTKNQVLEIQRRNEIITANEWRRKINLPKRDDPGGDEFTNPNVKAAGAATDPAADPADKPTADIAEPAKNLLADALGRAVRRVGASARKASKNSLAFEQWLEMSATTCAQVCAEVVERPAALWRAITNCNGLEVADDLSGAVSAALAPLIEPPHTANDLEANVERAVRKLETELPSQLLSTMEKSQ